MRFRWKLLILLLTISLGPLVVMRTIGVGSLLHFRDTLIERIRENRITSEQDRLQRIADAHAGHPSAKIVSTVLEAVVAFRGQIRQEDDITLVVINVLEV